MPTELEEYQEKPFEEIKHVDELGNDYWKAREKLGGTMPENLPTPKNQSKK